MERTLKLNVLGVQQVTIPALNNFTVSLPPGQNSLEAPANLPPDVTKIVRNELQVYVELTVQANLIADGQEKTVTLSAIFG